MSDPLAQAASRSSHPTGGILPTSQAQRGEQIVIGKAVSKIARRRTLSPRMLGAVGAMVLCFGVNGGFAHAQLSTADILGTVTDVTGAVIPNAKVTLTNNGTQEKRTTTSNNSGEYDFTLLPVGTYSVAVDLPGFKTSNVTNVAIEAGDRAREDVKLQTGAVTETVSVEAETPLLQADNATVSSTVTAKAVQDLPLNGRNFVQLVQLVPGANEGPGNGLTSGGRPDDRRQSASFSVNGQDDTLNNYTIDGIDDNERIIGTIGVRPDVEGIQEITVETNSYSPEAGRTAGGVVSIITRAGTNQFHGTAYEFFRNDIFDARNVLQTNGRKPELRQNQYGGSIGGPIIKDRTFFFGDYEGLRQVNGLTYISTIPDLYEWNAINSQAGETPQTLIAAGAGTAPYAVDPIALNYLKLYPHPNVGSCATDAAQTPNPSCLVNNFVLSPTRTQYSNAFDVRVDHRFNDKNQFFARYDYNKVNTFTPPALGTVNGFQVSGGQYIFAGPATDAAQQYGFGLTHIFTPRLILDLRAAFTRINNLSLPLNAGTNADQRISGGVGTFGANLNNSPAATNLTPISFPGFADIGDGSYVPLQDIDNTFQYLGTVSYTLGNHNIKAGASFIRRQARNVQSPFVAGQYSFGIGSDNTSAQGANGGSGGVGGGGAGPTPSQQRDNGLASSLVGAFSGSQRVVDLAAPDYRTYEPSFFIQDSWKVNPKLTLLYGGRYDVFTPFTEAHSKISNFDFFQALNSTAANVQSALKIANVNGVDGHAGIQTDYSNFAPRVGFAYSAAPTTIVRGGYGLSYFPGNYTSNTDLKNVPFISVYQPNCQSTLAVQIEVATQGRNTGNAACNAALGQATTFDQGLPLPTPPDVSNLHAINPLSFNTETSNFRSGLIQQFNLQVEQQFGANVFTIGYVGNIGQHLPEVINDINQPAPYSTNPYSPLYYGNLPNPGFRSASGPRRLDNQFPGTPNTQSNLNNVGLVQSEGISNYNALQTSLQRRFSKGLAFDANYTWSKALSDITGYSQEGDNQGYSNANPFQIRQIEYGLAENDIQNRFALSLNYTFQYGQNWHGIKKEALAGWEFNTIAVWQSGKPFTILNGGGNNDNTTYIDPATGKTVTEGPGNRAVPNNSGGRDRPNQTGDPRLANKTNAKFFNIAAFSPQPTGTIGNTQRNSLFGPHYRHVDVSLFKDFPVTERVNLQFRAESFNISNTPDFLIGLGSANAQLGNPAFGTVSNFDPNYTPRLFQFALKAQF